MQQLTAVSLSESPLPRHFRESGSGKGFTLIELSIILVIIGLIVGGVLVGRDLIKAAEARAEISQIEKYQTAVNTFRDKYNGLPGDLNISQATQFGFAVGANCIGQQGGRNGDGLIFGDYGQSVHQGEGEIGLFWGDLSSANLIDGTFPAYGAPAIKCTPVGQSSLSYSQALNSITVLNYLPLAKIGNSTNVYVYSYQGLNLFALSAGIFKNASGNTLSNASILVKTAYNIDAKVDDGVATAGRVQAVYTNEINSTYYFMPYPSQSGDPDTSATCFNSTTGMYSVQINNGSGMNCALSFRFQ